MTRPQRRATDQHPRWLLPGIVLLIVLGSVSVFVSVDAARNADVARQDDVEEVQQLLEELADLEARSTERLVEQQDHAVTVQGVVCEIATTIALKLQLTVPACPPPTKMGGG